MDDMVLGSHHVTIPLVPKYGLGIVSGVKAWMTVTLGGTVAPVDGTPFDTAYTFPHESVSTLSTYNDTMFAGLFRSDVDMLLYDVAARGVIGVPSPRNGQMREDSYAPTVA
jgi:hypothetical protein